MAFSTRTSNKRTWPDGPWQSEPDEINWLDKKSRLWCRIKRNRIGALCGYVRIAKKHPCYGKSYNGAEDYYNLTEGQIWWRKYVKRDVKYFVSEIRVHGGLTFANYWDGGFWFGFDCAHAGDFCPKIDDVVPGMIGNVYRDISYVKVQTTNLARKLAEIGKALNAKR